jgi:hypothetical protein
MNLDNQTLRCIQTTKAELKKQLEQTDDPHIKQKIEHQIHCLSMEETETLNKLNIRLNDITLTEEEDDTQ